MSSSEDNPIRRWLGYGPGSASSAMRARRTAEFLRRFPELEDMTVIDLGGRPEFWITGGPRPWRVICVNLEKQVSAVDWIDCVTGDACAIRLSAADLVVSNSLLEHLGGQANRERFADNVRSLSDRYWLQTPYRYFPVEPHWMFPGMQFMPLAMKERVARRHWTQGVVYPPDYARRAVAWTELLSITDLRRLFPDGEVWREKIAGITKSIVAVRD